MFITCYTITQNGDRVGVLKFSKEGFSIPSLPELLGPISKMVINRHEVQIIESSGVAVIQIVPNDLTRNKILHAVLRRLKYTGFALEPLR
jgi:hypothetical protein